MNTLKCLFGLVLATWASCSRGTGQALRRGEPYCGTRGSLTNESTKQVSPDGCWLIQPHHGLHSAWECNSTTTKYHIAVHKMLLVSWANANKLFRLRTISNIRLQVISPFLSHLSTLDFSHETLLSVGTVSRPGYSKWAPQAALARYMGCTAHVAAWELPSTYMLARSFAVALVVKPCLEANSDSVMASSSLRPEGLWDSPSLLNAPEEYWTFLFSTVSRSLMDTVDFKCLTKASSWGQQHQ